MRGNEQKGGEGLGLVFESCFNNRNKRDTVCCDRADHPFHEQEKEGGRILLRMWVQQLCNEWQLSWRKAVKG